MHKVRFLAALILASVLIIGCGHKKKNQKQPEAGTNAEPDKSLYERAVNDIKHGKYEVGRLTLQTLINTYPDSEYLAKAKLAIGDAYFKEGGTANLTQAVEEYNNFIIFFPFLDEAAYAQMQIGLAHYRRLDKPDRDRTEARLAEDAFQVFIQKYPNSPLLPQAEQKLRDVQELLAEGDFRIARYYYVKGSLRASGARLLDITSRYPLYSQADKANWMLAQVFERAEKSDVAARFYAQIVRQYPLSPLTGDAKARLVKLGVPVPQPDPDALKRMQQEQAIDRGHTPFYKKPLGILHNGPDLRESARSGSPNLTPAAEEVAKLPEGPGGSGGGMNVGGSLASGGPGGGTSTGTVVAVVTPGSTGSTNPPVAGSADPPPTGSSTTTTTSGSATDPKPAPNADPSPSVNPPKGDSDTCKTDSKSKSRDKNKTADDKSKTDDKNKTDDKSKTDDKNKCRESTSKKKPWFKKIVP
jgi:outer membrane protein assembly factor BamD